MHPAYRFISALLALINFGSVSVWLWNQLRAGFAQPLWANLVFQACAVGLGTLFTYLACSRNPYRLKTGEVVDRYCCEPYTQRGAFTGATFFSPDRPSLVIYDHLPDREVPGVYRLKLRRHDGVVGWVKVTEATFNDHQVGSVYHRAA